MMTAESLGAKEFKLDYKTRYAYVAGSMYKGIASPEMVVRLGQAKLMGFYGTGGLRLDVIEKGIQYIQSKLTEDKPYGLNLLCNLQNPRLEQKTVELFFKYRLSFIEAAAFMQMTPALVLYRIKGLKETSQGLVIPNYVLAKISRPEIAELFMAPPPVEIVQALKKQEMITEEEARLSQKIPMSHDLCVEADSGGHTDRRIALTMIPTILRLKNKLENQYGYQKKIRIGAAGGIGTPEAAAAAFILGADFILTGSINQCTVEAGTSDIVKDLLQEMNVTDTAYVPAEDMFELGAQLQVFKKGVLFPARANKLYDLYKHYNSIDELDEATKNQLQNKYFKKSFEKVWEETRNYYQKELPDILIKAEQSPKQKMALLFRWYLVHTTRLALQGDTNELTDFQIHCGSALGAFNEWVKNTPLENWRNRHVDMIAEKLMVETANYLKERYLTFEGLK